VIVRLIYIALTMTRVGPLLLYRVKVKHPLLLPHLNMLLQSVIVKLKIKKIREINYRY